MSDTLFYEDYQRMIDGGGARFSVAEAHGIMTGMLCADQAVNFEQWRGEMRSTGILDDYVDARVLDSLLSLFEEIRETFAEDGFGFSPCLPDDDQPLDERAKALGEWCEGFLHGLGHARIKTAWPGQCREIIGDLIAISDVDPDSDEEDDEESLMELTEYVRVGVELIRIELQALDAPKMLH